MPKTVAVGVTGGIAAYKSAALVSMLKKRGYDVCVILTENAQQFVGALTFETLSGTAAITDTFERKETFDVKHVALAKKADMFIVAPATANVIGKLAAGVADDMLTTTLLAAKCPIIIAPAMNTAMYENASTQQNIRTLKDRGYHVMDTDEGTLACRDVGTGRMKEPDEIVALMDDIVLSIHDMHGVRVLISAGPTREMIDPVRFLSNRSSGKMGYAVAQAALDRGADVTLISGPVSLTPPDKADVVNVTTAAEMAQQVTVYAEQADIIVMAAAVADYTPENVSSQKIKKSGDMTIQLVRTEDILKSLGKSKRAGQLLVGFAAETQDFETNAQQKLAAKNLDMIALNDVSRQDEGFGADTNNIIIFTNDGHREDLGTGTKAALAGQIVALIKQQYDKLTTAR